MCNKPFDSLARAVQRLDDVFMPKEMTAGSRTAHGPRISVLSSQVLLMKATRLVSCNQQIKESRYTAVGREWGGGGTRVGRKNKYFTHFSPTPISIKNSSWRRLEGN